MRRGLQGNVVHVDLVGHQKQKAASSVKHKILFCHWMHTQTILLDLIKCYGFAGAPHTSGSRTDSDSTNNQDYFPGLT